MKAQRYDEAAQAYQASLQYRPNYAGTCLNLGYALKDSGRLDEAAQAWQEAARLAPNDPTARAELAGLHQFPALVGR
jgi:protein O-GlcNAc transferase